jgi:hypothetical protein
VARSNDPLSPSRLDPADEGNRRAGNRFDGTLFGVRYFSTTLEGCFAETLARLRPASHLRRLMNDDAADQQLMRAGSIASDWRTRRVAVRARIGGDLPFLDLGSPRTWDFLTTQLAASLSGLGVGNLDVEEIRGRDRRVTRLIANWTWSATNDDGFALYDGLRYVSALGDWENWAAFDDAPVTELDRQTILTSTPAFRTICDMWDLTAH